MKYNALVNGAIRNDSNSVEKNTTHICDGLNLAPYNTSGSGNIHAIKTSRTPGNCREISIKTADNAMVNAP
jgi:hypothetical protein